MFIGEGRVGAVSRTCVQAVSILPQRDRPSTGDIDRYNCAMSGAADRNLLGGLTPAAFLRRHWQKRALLVRDAIHGFGGLVSPAELFRLAGRDDVESRLVLREGGRWSLAHGPFRA